MKIIAILCFSLFYLARLAASSIASTTAYPDFCALAAKNDLVFSDFKRDPCYQLILEHLSFAQGMEYLSIIKQQYPFLFPYLNTFRRNDLLGNPITYSYEEYGSFSPTTLRYIKVAGDLITLFGDLSGKKIVEIGGGYGGQCTIVSSIACFDSYTIFDLPEVCNLTEKYLHALGIENTSCKNNIFESEENVYDLLISNYAFTEIGREEQLRYIHQIINKSKMGYMTCNFISDLFGINSLTLKELLSLIEMPNRKIEILPENPSTSASNILLIWKEI